MTGLATTTLGASGVAWAPGAAALASPTMARRTQA